MIDGRFEMLVFFFFNNEDQLYAVQLMMNRTIDYAAQAFEAINAGLIDKYGQPSTGIGDSDEARKWFKMWTLGRVAITEVLLRTGSDGGLYIVKYITDEFPHDNVKADPATAPVNGSEL